MFRHDSNTHGHNAHGRNAHGHGTPGPSIQEPRNIHHQHGHPVNRNSTANIIFEYPDDYNSQSIPRRFSLFSQARTDSNLRGSSCFSKLQMAFAIGACAVLSIIACLSLKLFFGIAIIGAGYFLWQNYRSSPAPVVRPEGNDYFVI